MINIYDCDRSPANEEMQIMLKSLKPGKKLPLLIDFQYPNNYLEQLIDENYLDALLEGYKLKFLKKRNVFEEEGKTYLMTNSRLITICKGIEDVVE